MTKCAIDTCRAAAHTRGWCKPHYDAWIRTGDPTTYRGDRSHLSLWDKLVEIGWTQKPNGCKEWNGYRNELGYGQFREGRGRGRLVRVHRVVFKRYVGPLRKTEHVMHICDNPSCSEPLHLRKGNQTDNMRDMRSKRRGYKDDWTHCPNGHLYTAAAPPGSTHNRCRECARERNRRYHAKKK